MKHLMLAVASTVLALELVPAASPAEGEFKLDTREEGNEVVFTGENVHPCVPYHAVISFAEFSNYRASIELPARVVLKPGAKSDLFRLIRVYKDAAAGYRVSMTYGPGDPDAKPDDSCLYLMPYEHGTKRLAGQGYLGSFTHQKLFALDFNMDYGMRVCAARDGVVFQLKDDSNAGGPGLEFSQKANFVSILHGDGTWADYAHFRLHGVAVKVGQRVEAGQVIGYAGSTGRTNGPHLHIAVYRATWDGSATLPTAFLGRNGKPITVEEGRWYYAYHPGGAPFEAVLGETLVESELEKHREKAPATGKVEFRTESVDNKILLYCRNGTRKDRPVTFEFSEIVNLESSKRVPLTLQVPAGTEIYALTLTQRPGGGRASYRLQFTY
jgi:murein DD-endopeptidase MepM/ murein hydrolase activator NlpD